ncbi:MAG: hypothetical protein IJ297_00575 [Clostridia bacterium]|nr:hypothetical protein [Clostridia bacterium]
MKRKAIIVTLNTILILPFIIFFKYGGNVTIWMLPIWAVMSVVNTLFSDKIQEIVIFNSVMAVFACLGIWIDALLYFYYITYDSVGVAVMQLETVVMLIYVALLTLIECLVKYLADKAFKGE